MKSRPLDVLALLLFASAVVMLTWFHLMVFIRPGKIDEKRGWELWPDMWEGVQTMDFSDPLAAMAGAGLVFLCALTLASPFLIMAMGRSRLLWWLVFCGSVICLFGTTGVMVIVLAEEGGHSEELTPAFWLGMTAPLLHLAGLFVVRRRKVPER